MLLVLGNGVEGQHAESGPLVTARTRCYRQWVITAESTSAIMTSETICARGSSMLQDLNISHLSPLRPGYDRMTIITTYAPVISMSEQGLKIVLGL